MLLTAAAFKKLFVTSKFDGSEDYLVPFFLKIAQNPQSLFTSSFKFITACRYQTSFEFCATSEIFAEYIVNYLYYPKKSFVK